MKLQKDQINILTRITPCYCQKEWHEQSGCDHYGSDIWSEKALKYSETFYRSMISRRKKLEKPCRYWSTATKSYYLFFSYQAIVGRWDSANILLPGVTTLSSFPILEQTNIVLVTLLSFETDLMKNTILSPLSYWDW